MGRVGLVGVACLLVLLQLCNADEYNHRVRFGFPCLHADFHLLGLGFSWLWFFVFGIVIDGGGFQGFCDGWGFGAYSRHGHGSSLACG